MTSAADTAAPGASTTDPSALSNLDHVQDYVSHGQRVVPLHEVLADGTCSCGNANGTCPKPNGKDSTGKHPRFSGWLAGTIVGCTPTEIEPSEASAQRASSLIT